MSDNKPADWNTANPYPTESTTTDRAKRIKICNGCEFLNSMKFCTKCNCFMPIKTYLKSKKCPAGYW